MNYLYYVSSFLIKNEKESLATPNVINDIELKDFSTISISQEDKDLKFNSEILISENYSKYVPELTETLTTSFPKKLIYPKNFSPEKFIEFLENIYHTDLIRLLYNQNKCIFCEEVLSNTFVICDDDHCVNQLNYFFSHA